MALGPAGNTKKAETSQEKYTRMRTQARPSPDTTHTHTRTHARTHARTHTSELSFSPEPSGIYFPVNLFSSSFTHEQHRQACLSISKADPG